MTKKVVCTFMISCIFLCGCNTGTAVTDTVINTQKDMYEATTNTEKPSEDLPKDYEREEDSMEDTDFISGSIIYWTETIKNQKTEIETIINWLKNIQYCKEISFSDGRVYTMPDIKETREKIRAEKGFKEIKKLISQNGYDIRCCWVEDKRISIMHRFDIGEISGNYCLEYLGRKLKKTEKKNRKYKKIEGNYYSSVIFYK